MSDGLNTGPDLFEAGMNYLQRATDAREGLDDSPMWDAKLREAAVDAALAQACFAGARAAAAGEAIAKPMGKLSQQDRWRHALGARYYDDLEDDDA